MLGGFLAALNVTGKRATLTCCVPAGAEGLARRFPAVRWRPYGMEERRRCIQECDVWLGLGGTPWQSAVSTWFAEHLAAERALCAEAGRPMFFLGVGGQDAAAYALPALRRAAEQAEMIWTRDDAHGRGLGPRRPGRAGPGRGRSRSHLLSVARRAPPPAAPGRLTAVLNFDYGDWAGMTGALAALRRLPATERVWLAQESRPLPGAELWLHARLEEEERGRWILLRPDATASLEDELGRWPSGQWQLGSRYHATLAAAWSGSRAVVLATNEKLRSAAEECGYTLFPLDGDPARLPALLLASPPPPPERMRARAALAERACAEFFSAIGL